MAYTLTDDDIRTNLQSFHAPIEMPGGYTFDHVATLKMINLYYNGKFESGDTDDQGFYKYFYNIVVSTCDIAEKFIDLDTKNFIFTSEETGLDYKLWIMEHDFKRWVKEQGFGKLINDAGEDYVQRGHLVLKKTKEDWTKATIENIRMDTAARNLNNSMFVYEVLDMTKREIDSMNWDKNAVKELYARDSKARSFRVYECYDYCGDASKPWDRTYRADLLCTRSKSAGMQRSAETEINDANKYIPSVVLYDDSVDELPYRETKWKDVPGRWLGKGYVELLEVNQIRENELENLKAKSLYITSLKLFTTADENVKRNVLTGVDNGDVLVTKDPIVPVANEERNLTAFSLAENRWGMNTNQKAFTQDIVRGEQLKSGTPLGVANLQASMVVSFYEKKRENLGLFFSKLILEDVLPSFKDEKKGEHTVRFGSSVRTFKKLRRAIVECIINDNLARYVNRTGRIPSEMEIDNQRKRMEDEIARRGDISLKLPKGFYDDVEANMDVVTTGEQLDIAGITQTLQSAMGLVASNPAVLQNPTTRAIFIKLLELAGVPAIELDVIEEEAAANPAPTQPLTPGSPVAAPSGAGAARQLQTVTASAAQ